MIQRTLVLGFVHKSSQYNLMVDGDKLWIRRIGEPWQLSTDSEPDVTVAATGALLAYASGDLLPL